MKVALLGPTSTASLAEALGQDMTGLPTGETQTPLAPLAAALVAAGHWVNIVTLDYSIDSEVSRKFNNFEITYLPFRAGPRFRARIRSLDLFSKEIRLLTNHIKQTQPDIVHAHWTYEYAEAAVRSAVPHLVTMHDLGWDYFFQMRDPYRLMRLLMKLRTMPRVKNLSVVAPFMVDKLWQYGFVGSVEVIANGIEIPSRYSDPASRDLTSPVIVTVGNDGNLKNVRSSILAFNLIKKVIPKAELHLFGPGLDMKYANGADGIVGHGNVDHPFLMKFLRDQATLLIHPSRIETFGVIIAEAKARAIPVVAGSQSGGVSFVCGDQGALLVDIENPKAISKAALSFLQDRSTYLSACQDARADAAARFSDQIIANQYLGLYRHITRISNSYDQHL
jgi:L-malate glycosyltransferase